MKKQEELSGGRSNYDRKGAFVGGLIGGMVDFSEIAEKN